MDWVHMRDSARTAFQVIFPPLQVAGIALLYSQRGYAGTFPRRMNGRNDQSHV